MSELSEQLLERLATELSCDDFSIRDLVLSFLDAALEADELRCESVAKDTLELLVGNARQRVTFDGAITRFRLLLPYLAFLADKDDGQVTPYGGHGKVRHICGDGSMAELGITFTNSAGTQNLRLWWPCA